MNLIIYKELFEQEFERELKPPADFYSRVKTNEDMFEYRLIEEVFYHLSPPIVSYMEKGSLNVLVTPNNIKTLYVSYMTLDTKFEKLPDDSFVEIDRSNGPKLFYLDIDITVIDDGLEVIPFIIHYNKKGKKKMTRVTLRNQLIRIAEDEKKLRLTFKVKGNGNFTINNIRRSNLGIDKNGG